MPVLDRKMFAAERRDDVLAAISAPKCRLNHGELPYSSEERCGNGGCTRRVYRGRYCYRCWAGVKWTSLHQRLENVNGKCGLYEAVKLGFTREEFLNWVLSNHPDESIQNPSLDRIRPELGYTHGNLQWVESRKNSRNVRRDDPDGMKFCTGCKQLKPATLEHFGVYNPKTRHAFYKLQSRCRVCRKGRS